MLDDDYSNPRWAAHDDRSNSFISTRLSTLPPVPPIRWLWENVIPAGHLTLLAGPPSRAKSFLALDLAARVSRGSRMPTFPPDDPLASYRIPDSAPPRSPPSPPSPPLAPAPEAPAPGAPAPDPPAPVAPESDTPAPEVPASDVPAAPQPSKNPQGAQMRCANPKICAPCPVRAPLDSHLHATSAPLHAHRPRPPP